MTWWKKVLNSFNVLRNKIKTRNLLLKSPKNLYSDLMSNEKIENIINSIPEGLTNLEKAYYIYIELGKILKEDPNFVLKDEFGRNANYNNKIDERFYGICKSISELYVSVLKDPRIGIKAKSVNRHIGSPISHVDTIINIDGKNYICNLISDLTRIKTGRRVNSFCFDLSRNKSKDDTEYLNRLEREFGTISYLDRTQVEELDKKLHYSYFLPGIMKPEERGIYTDDTIELLAKEMRDPEKLKKYVFHGKDVPEEEQLKYKIDFIFENIGKLVDFNGEFGHFENVENYNKIATKLFSLDELGRIVPYSGTVGNDRKKMISIIKLLPHENSRNKLNTYYVFSQEENRYKEKSIEEMRDFIDGMLPEKFRIVGNTRRYAEIDLEELGL